MRITSVDLFTLLLLGIDVFPAQYAERYIYPSWIVTLHILSLLFCLLCVLLLTGMGHHEAG